MFCIRIAELVIAINNHYPYVERMCADYIVSSCENADISIEAAHEDIDIEQKEAGFPCTKEYCEFICIYRAISCRLVDYDAFIMHGACVEYCGDGYIFLAKSGTGKSTHISLWKKMYGDKAHIINGDKPVIRLKDGIFYAYGTPWCGKEGWNVNTGVPLKAMCFLERGELNCIDRLDSSAVMVRLCHQILMPENKGDVIRYLDIIDNLIRSTECYIMRCNMDEEAAVVALQGMSGRGSIRDKA